MPPQKSSGPLPKRTTLPRAMVGHDQVSTEELPEEYRRFLGSLGPEGLRQMIEVLTDVVLANPRRRPSPWFSGLPYTELGDHRCVVEDYGSAIALGPDDTQARVAMARVYTASGEYRFAIEKTAGLEGQGQMARLFTLGCLR